MGYIDESTHTFFCPQCSIQEKIKIFDKGTMWSGSHWQPGRLLEHFDVQWAGGGSVEPTVTEVHCKKCKTVASVS
jgi:hypothetical protein